MVSQLFSASFTTLALVLVSIFLWRRLWSWQDLKNADHAEPSRIKSISIEMTRLSQKLASAIPNSVIFRQEAAAFKKSMNSYWAQQECEVTPACVVQPRDVQQLSIAMTILKSESVEQSNSADPGNGRAFFAIRSGGHSPVSGAASIEGGIMIDLSHFCEVTPSKDGSSVVIGSGAKWIDVSKSLDAKGLAVVGGRASAVGVGGLALGGGLSYFSPRFGLVCSNIISFEIVLASGSVTTASASNNSDLWFALKGGSNNFGIVTRFTVRSFPCSKIWSGFIYLPAFQASKVLTAFHDYVGRGNAGDVDLRYDDYAAGPLVCFSYIQQLGIQIIAVNLVHTANLQDERQWPVCWRYSGFAFLWRFWSTCKVRTLTSAIDETNGLNPPGRRQVFATTTIKDDLATIHAMHAAYSQAVLILRSRKIKGLVWTLVLQPLLPQWARKGDPHPLGLLENTYERLVIVSFTVNWDECRDDDFVKEMTRDTVEGMDAVARARGKAHPFRYLNYCADWQKPFEGYGEKNLRFLREVSKKYDPDGLFQTGCSGGFKLDVSSDTT